MDKAIGGYFGLELRQGEHYHSNAIKLNTARNCLEYILVAKQYTKIYIPYYTCEVVLEPIKKYNIDYEFYHINENLEPIKNYKLLANEAFLYTNYFGLKDEFIKKISNIYQNQFIVDNAQAFYNKPMAGIDTFYSARKFFGVSDGAYLYTDKFLPIHLDQDISYNRMSHLLKRLDVSAEFGYADFANNDNSLINEPIKRMSNLTDAMLRSINYEEAKQKRIENFNYLHLRLKHKNIFQFKVSDSFVPMVYPFMTKNIALRKRLIDNKVYIATYWNNVLGWAKKNDLEYALVDEIIPIPLDQRYNRQCLEQIVSIVI